MEDKKQYKKLLARQCVAGFIYAEEKMGNTHGKIFNEQWCDAEETIQYNFFRFDVFLYSQSRGVWEKERWRKFQPAHTA